MGLPFYKPQPAPPGVFGDKPLPHKQSSALSRLFFFWMAPLLKVGYSRPIEPEDVWDLKDDLQAKYRGDLLQDHYQARLPPSMRTIGYRPANNPLNPARKILFTPDQSKDDLDERADRIEMLSNLNDQTGNDSEALQLTAQLTRASSISLNTALAAPVTSKVPSPVFKESSPSHPSLPDLSAKFGKRTAKKIQAGQYAVEEDKVYDMSLWRALYQSGKRRLWIAVAIQCVSAMIRIVVPLVSKVLIDEITRARAFRLALAAGESTADLSPPKSIGYSIGISVALFVMLVVSSVFTYHAQVRWGELGLSVRGAIIDLISRKSMRLSSKSRMRFSAGRINTMVTADASYCDWVWQDLVIGIAMLPQIVVGCGLLIWQLGVSALVALAVLVASGPVQQIVFGKLLRYRRQHQTIMDKRVRLLTEVINNIRAVKLYAYESLFGCKVQAKRQEEVKALRKLSACNAVSSSFMYFIPTLAAIAAFVTYSATGNALDAGRIFSALQFLNILRNPIAWFPRIIACLADVYNATLRIGAMLSAEEQIHDLVIDPEQDFAIDMNGTFKFEVALEDPEKDQTSTASRVGKRLAALKERIKSPLSTPQTSSVNLTDCIPDPETKDAPKEPFQLKDLDLQIKRGALVCIVGRVGAGKSALLSSMINEVKKVSGHVKFGGRLSYVPQHAWVQSGSIRDNITFSTETKDIDMARVVEVVEASCLSIDLASLQDGVSTNIGERGITLSGGQRQRICIARAAYEDTEIVLLDDPLSAVDAQVGHHLLHKCILNGPLADRTRILVTHHLDVLPRADVILMMQGTSEEGHIVQQGSYKELMSIDGPFRALIDDYGSKMTKEQPEDQTIDAAKQPGETKTTEARKLEMAEDRETGSIAWNTYRTYISRMGNVAFTLSLAAIFIAAQAASIFNILWLGWWAGNRFQGLSNGAYMAVYAGTGLVFAACLFLSTYILAVLGLRASFNMFAQAWDRVMRSPTTWHDRTPTGRIISRLSKDIDSMDYRLPSILWSVITNSLVMVGTFALVVYTYPWLGLAFIPIVGFMYLVLSFYQQTSRELKRVDSLLRSYVFSNFAEQLSGLAVIKAFHKQARFENRLQASLDEQNKLYAARWYVQSWLNMRVATAGQILVLAVAVFGVATRDQFDAYKFGVVLTYVITTAFVLQDLVPNLAMAEQEMNNVERVSNYTQLQPEGAPVRPTDPPEENWPTQGAISFQNVQLRYRPELPLVLKGLSFDIKPGEKVGIIGRTGAGKSSLVQALYRTVDLAEGQIQVDGVDLAGLGLETLRGRLAIIPQESFLFAGTVRDNIDPAGTHSDAKLNDALALIHGSTATSSSLRDKFKLETEVQNEGANFSAGERQLLALMRALVRGCKVLVLDEATSSVDPETDALIQRIIQTEFSHVTLISIAHRLQTVAYYDRILVMDAGVVAEFDSPLTLFDTPDSIFRSLCDTKQLSRDGLLSIQADAAGMSG